MIVLYSKDNCKFCEMAKDLLKTKQFDFTEYRIGKDITREEFMEQFPNIRTAPAIFINGEYIGGWTNILEWVDQYNDELSKG